MKKSKKVIYKALQTQFPGFTYKEIPSPLEKGWRYRAKLMVQNGKIGLYKEGTHEVVDATSHEDHHPIINEVATSLLPLALTMDPKIRAIQCTVSPDTNTCQLALFVTEALDEKIELYNSKIHSVWQVVETEKSNTLFRGTWIHSFGPPTLPISFLGVQFQYHPGAFIQANIPMYSRFLADLIKLIPDKKRLAEFYAGVGVMGVLLSKKIPEVFCVEVNPYAEISYAAQAPKENERCRFFCESAENALAFFKKHPEIFGAELTILDPPRKGVDVQLLYTIQSPWIGYLSCNPQTFLRDAIALKERGYHLVSLAQYDFFPKTGHDELFGVFERTT